MNEATKAAALSSDARAMMAFEAGKKSAAVSYVLWFFLGGLGGHRFYNGRPGSAVGQIALSVLGWATIFIGFGFVLLFAIGVWLLIDVFLISGWVRAFNAELISKLDSLADTFREQRQMSLADAATASVQSPVIMEAKHLGLDAV